MANPPLSAAQDLSNPIKADGTWPTIGTLRLKIPPALEDAAKSTRSWPTLERLHALTGGENDLSYLGALVSFISAKEVIVILGRWADQNRFAEALERLGRGTWGHAGLADAMRPFLDDQKSSLRLHGSLTPQYLAAMAAARRPVQNQAFAEFIQRLRTFCLVRSLSTLDQHQIYREKALEQVCKVLRRACDHSVDDGLKWLKVIQNSETDIDEFASELQFRCAAEMKRSGATEAQKIFYRQLRIVAGDGPWRAVMDGMHAPCPDLSPLPSPIDDLLPEFTGSNAPLIDLLHTPLIDGTAGTIVQFPSDPKNTASRNENSGKGLILEHLEQVQFFRQSWHHLSIEEEHALFQRVDSLLSSLRQIDRAGATMTLIACIAGRTMSAVGKVQVDTSLSDDWTLDPLTQELKRRPPRFERRWRAESIGQDRLHWVKPLLDQLCIRLCGRATNELTTLLRGFDGQDLDALWQSVSPDISVGTWFKESFLKDSTLGNLSSPSTAKVLQVSAYGHSFNHAFVRLVGAQTRTALPSACAYGAYNSADLRGAFSVATAAGLFTVVEPSPQSVLNSCGSELDVLPVRIREAIADLINRANAARNDPNRWVEAHNLLTSLCVVSLLASTGARPVHSPFESLSAIDMEMGLLLVEDKVAGPTRGTRLCILSDFARELLCRFYLPHLASLADHLHVTTPRFASHLHAILARDPEAQLPLFFFLRDDPDLDWLEINETQLSLESGVSWPLPWNVFRHLHATELVHRGVEQEVVDALLAHADGTAQSHGCYSTRIPIDDLATARIPINEMQRHWGFDASKLFHSPHPPKLRSVTEPLLMASRPFGRTARAHARDSIKVAAIERARSEIDRLVGGRPPSSLSPDDWHKVALKMLFREDHVRHSFASLRYEVFEKYLSSIWQEQRVLTRMKRGFSISPPSDPFFNEEVIGANDKLSALKEGFESALQSLNGPQLGARLAATLATIELILHCGITHSKALLDVLCLRPSVKLVKFQGVYWVERSYSDTWKDSRPVFRAPITGRAAQWLAISTRGLNQLKIIPNVLPELERLSPALAGQSTKLLIDQLTKLQHQLNALRLPGTDAAYLRGTLIFSGLPHRDWYRLHTGTAPNYRQLPAPHEPATDPDAMDQPPFVLAVQSKAKQAAPSGESTPEKCAALFEEIRKVISQDSSHPKRSVAAIEAAISGSIYGHGDVPYALASFICHLLTRPSKTGVRNNLRTSTVRRSWYALFQPICDLAHDKNIFDLDDDEFTEMYGDVVDWWHKHFDQRSKAPSQTIEQFQPDESSFGRLAPEERAADAGRRTLIALREFHQYIEIAFGADSPEWSEISDEAAGVIGRPGLVLLQEYLLGIKSLVGERPICDLDDSTLRNSFVWLLCGRFGLRLSEAVGLYRSDWMAAGEAIVLAIQGNRVRPLKTPRSRRKIPLIEPLTPQELNVVDEVLRRWLIGNDRKLDTPLIPGVSRDTYRLARSSVGATLGALAKSVTCNQDATLHHLRHSFACRMNSLLRGQPMGKADDFCVPTSEHACRLLLGRNRSDRRVMWSVARLLGHSSPSVASRSYLHGFDHWTPRPGATEYDIRPAVDGAEMIDLDALVADEGYGTILQSVGAQDSTTSNRLSCLLIFLRLSMQGHSQESALTYSLAEPSGVATFYELLSRAGAKTGLSGTDSFALVGSIHMDRWKSLVLRCKGVSIEQMPQLAFDALETVGRRRQILLFREPHFEEFSAFVFATKIKPTDICLIESRNLNRKLASWIRESNLSEHLAPASHFGPTFQLDTAEFGDPTSIQKDRVVAIPTRQGGSIHTTQTLIILWLSWLSIRLTSSTPNS